jgi:hypothetical protein
LDNFQDGQRYLPLCGQILPAQHFEQKF